LESLGTSRSSPEMSESRRLMSSINCWRLLESAPLGCANTSAATITALPIQVLPIVISSRLEQITWRRRRRTRGLRRLVLDDDPGVRQRDLSPALNADRVLTDRLDHADRPA